MYLVAVQQPSKKVEKSNSIQINKNDLSSILTHTREKERERTRKNKKNKPSEQDVLFNVITEELLTLYSTVREKYDLLGFLNNGTPHSFLNIVRNNTIIKRTQIDDQHIIQQDDDENISAHLV